MPTRAKRDEMKPILNLQLIRGFLYIVGAAALFVLLKDVTAPVNLFYTSSDSIAAQGQTIFVPAIRTLLDAPIGVIAAIGVVFSGIIALYRASKGKIAYTAQVKRGVSPLKWVDIGISSAVIMAVVAMVAGVTDPTVIKMSAGLVLLTCYLGWVVEKQNEKANKADWSAFIASLISGVLAWFPVVSSLVLTWMYGAVRFPWYSYALSGAVAIGFIFICKNQFLHLKKIRGWKDNATNEFRILLSDIFTKVAFVIILIVGLRG